MHTQLSEKAKRNVMMLADAVMLSIALWASVVLRYGDIRHDVGPFWVLFLVGSVSGVLALSKFGLYRAMVRYIGPSSMVPIVQGISVAVVVVSLCAYVIQLINFPRSSPIIFWFISILFVGGSRIIVRGYFYGFKTNYLTREKVAIYGAGESGAQLAISLLNGSDYMPVAFIDDDRKLRKNTIHGIRIYDSEHLDRLVETYGISQILLAVPSATIEQRRNILSKLSDLPIFVRTVPNFADLLSGNASLSEIKEVEIGDLLGRDTVPPDQSLLEASIRGKSVLVTGAGGTIGSELCRKILSQSPSKLVLFDNSEYALYRIERELQSTNDDRTELVFLLGSIMNKTYVSKVMNSFGVQTIYHAAAFKHVPMVESNIIEGVRNNVVGTWNVVEAAEENGVEALVLISSDKAVRPTNVMGATKRMAELIVKAFASHSQKTRYSMVRFGNVLKSSGSVVPLFEKQILTNGPVTVTNKDATRYFMTASEAAELVIQAGAMAEGGELYVLDMGDPVKINDLATRMIHLHGREVKGDAEKMVHDRGAIEIEYIGLRPGEKLYEELVIGESISGTRHSKIMMAEEASLTFETMTEICETLKSACANSDFDVVRQTLETYVSGYIMHKSDADPVLAIERKAASINNVLNLKN